MFTKKNIVTIETIENKLSLEERCEILNLARSSYYYKAKEPTNNAKEIMHLIEGTFENRPTKGHRMIWQDLIEIEIKIGRDRTLKYMKQLGLKAIYPKKKTSIANKEHKKYPYLLRDLDITEPNQVWATDITYLKLPTGDCYLAAIIDWCSRKILSYRISNSLDKQFCIEALNEAVDKYGTPLIFNSDQGCQFTSVDFIAELEKRQIRISMDSVGRWADNIIIERFFRTLKYEDFYLCKYETITQLKFGTKNFMEYYNNNRKHSSLGYMTPSKAYEKGKAMVA